MLVRLQKFLADAGVASRRSGEQMIVDGRVAVNGAVVKELGTKVDPDHAVVLLDGTPVRARRKIYVALHKPPGYICTRSDPEKRHTVGDLLPKEWSNLYPVGRLDFESEGLLFLTNDGEFCLRMTHPRYGLKKTYIVVVEGLIDTAMLARITQGVEDHGEMLKADSVRLISGNNSHSVVEVILTGGKNREIRRIFEVLGRVIVRLVRTRIGPIKLGELPPSKWRTLTETEIASLIS